MDEQNFKRIGILPGQYLTFVLGENWYGVPIRDVREINQMLPITPIPRTPEFIKGVINLRGKIIPLLDLRLKFGLEEIPTNRNTCIIIFEAEAGLVGVIVDSVREVVDLKIEQIESSPTLGDEQNFDFLMGMGKVQDRVLILVDLIKSLSKENFIKTIVDLPKDEEQRKAS